MTTVTALHVTREPIQIKVSEYKGVMRLDIRHYYGDFAGDLNPTQKGVNIPLADAGNLVASIESVIEAGGKRTVEAKTHNPVVVSANEYKGKQRFDVRHYWTDKTGELNPTQKGVNIPLENAPDLLAAISAVLNESIAATAGVECSQAGNIEI